MDRPEMQPADDVSRRNFHKLTLGALAGLAAGAQTQAFAALTAQEGEKDKKEVHVCRGLNSCKGNGAEADVDGDGKNDVNACAGQGACATAKQITCGGNNDCKGQGGCGPTPGENDCKGKGACHVPLNDGAWKRARARFEERMKKDKKSYGDPPAKDKTPQGKKKK